MGNFADLGIGMYSIYIATMRGGMARQTEVIDYEIIKPPTLHFVGIDPNEIHLPLEELLDINISMIVNGREIDSIQGVFELSGSDLKTTVNINT